MINSSIHIVKFAEVIPSRDECRELVKDILHSELNYDSPPKLVFNDFGKPSIMEDPKLAFSYAHSPSQLVIAIDRAADSIGVDTESIHRQSEIMEIADLAFSSEELTRLKSSEYVKTWCIKEAAVKRLGKGFRDANPSDISVKINRKSYELLLGDRIIQTGYFLSIDMDDDIIIVCNGSPIEEFSLQHHSHKNYIKD